MFERLHHRRIAAILASLDGDRLRKAGCWFGGGTAIALLKGEYRESVDMDFLVSDLQGYRWMRQHLDGARGLDAVLRPGAGAAAVVGAIRADQYGIRTSLDDGFGRPIKFEIVLEARMVLDVPPVRRAISGVTVMGDGDLAASKLLANADRWRDDSVFSRDIIDLAMLDLPPRLLQPALAKSYAAYGEAILASARRALDRLDTDPGHVRRCLAAMSMNMAPAALHQRLRLLRRRIEQAARGAGLK